MTRTNNTARASKVRTVKVAPEQLQEIDLSAAELPQEIQEPQEPQEQPTSRLRDAMEDAKLRAALQATRKAPKAQIMLTTEQAAAFSRMGWKAPTVGYVMTEKPEDRERINNCRGGNVYNAMAAVLRAGHTLSVAEVADLWADEIGTKTTLRAILKQTAIRAGRAIQQQEMTITAV
jgi:hypothetical protein